MRKYVEKGVKLGEIKDAQTGTDANKERRA
jgi:hypothetical protein